ncbi:MAG: protein kinase [Myxococcales bacterium]|nr:protein kinase [Myxococcales bacterium]
MRVEAPPQDPYLGTRILNQFRLEKVLGSGGMGIVYQGFDEGLGRKVAVKILHRDLITNKDIVARFHREAQIAHQLDHPGIVRVVLFGQLSDGNLYLVLEHLEGPTLLQALEQDGHFLPARAVKIISQIADAVGYTHARGVIHRDLKPENIILTRRGDDPEYPKVLDFGIAKSLLASHSFVTQTGLIFGTARYISPEGAAGEPVDQRSDVYSLAVIAYQLMAGRTPFESDEPVQLLVKHMHEAPAPLRKWPSAQSVPVEVEDVVMRALAKNPEARHEDARAFGAALRAALEGPDAVAPREGGIASLVRTSSMPLLSSSSALERPILLPDGPHHPRGGDAHAPRQRTITHPSVPVYRPPEAPAPSPAQGTPPLASAPLPVRMELPRVDPAALAPTPLPTAATAMVSPDDDDDLQVPGLPRKAKPRLPRGAEVAPPDAATLQGVEGKSARPASALRTVGLVVLSSVIALGVMTGGAYGLRLFPGQQREDELGALLRRAEAAFSANRLVHSDNGEDVEDLTDAVLAIDRDNARATRLRRNAAAQLKAAADAERTAHRPERAIPFLQDALRLLDDATLRADLADAQREAQAQRPPAVPPPTPRPNRPQANPNRAVVSPTAPQPAPAAPPPAPNAARPSAPGAAPSDPGVTFTPGRDPNHEAPGQPAALDPAPPPPQEPAPAPQPAPQVVQTPFGPMRVSNGPAGGDPGVRRGEF